MPKPTKIHKYQFRKFPKGVAPHTGRGCGLSALGMGCGPFPGPIPNIPLHPCWTRLCRAERLTNRNSTLNSRYGATD